jgi:hypothetical protein
LTNNHFSANLVTGYTYHGVRTNRACEKSGKQYFEVMIVPSEDDTKFNRGSTIYMGIGVANEKFNPENCCSGWTKENSGIGYYNDGQIYALSERHFGNDKKMSFKAGDRVGMELDMDASTLVFYINDLPVTDPIRGLADNVYPHLILANDIKNKVTITTGKRGINSYSSDALKLDEPAVKKTLYEAEIQTMGEMGFPNRDVCLDLLMQFNGDVSKAINVLLG